MGRDNLVAAIGELVNDDTDFLSEESRPAGGGASLFAGYEEVGYGTLVERTWVFQIYVGTGAVAGYVYADPNLSHIGFHVAELTVDSRLAAVVQIVRPNHLDVELCLILRQLTQRPVVLVPPFCSRSLLDVDRNC